MRFLIFIFLFCFSIKDCYPSSEEINIYSGNINGLYYRTSVYMCKIISKVDNVNCNVILTSGSLENLERLNSNPPKLAIIQKDTLKFSKNKNIKSLGTIYKEGIFIFYNSKLKIKTVKDFNGLITSIDTSSGNFISAKKYISDINILEPFYKTKSSMGVEDICEDRIDYKVLTVGLDKDLINYYVNQCPNIRIYSFSKQDTKKEELLNIKEIINSTDDIFIPVVEAILISNGDDGNEYKYLFEKNSMLNTINYIKNSK